MAVSTKDQAWQDLERQFSRTIDRLGKRIDLGIMDTVVALNANEISTTASCEGHLDWGAPYPWVDVGCCNDPRVEEREQEIAILLSEGKRDSQELEQLHLELKHIHYQEELKLTEALESFYRVHPLDYDRHLTLLHITRGGCHMRPQGADIQELRTLDERANKLKEYQAEMQAFAAFLKRRFLGEPEEYSVPEAAELLGIKPDTLTHLLMSNRLKAELRGRNYYIKHEDLMRFKDTPRKVGRPRKER